VCTQAHQADNATQPSQFHQVELENDSVITQQLQLCLSSTAKFEAAAAQTDDSCKRFALSVVSVLDSHEHSAVKLLLAGLYGVEKNA